MLGSPQDISAPADPTASLLPVTWGTSESDSSTRRAIESRARRPAGRAPGLLEAPSSLQSSQCLARGVPGARTSVYSSADHKFVISPLEQLRAFGPLRARCPRSRERHHMSRRSEAPPRYRSPIRSCRSPNTYRRSVIRSTKWNGRRPDSMNPGARVSTTSPGSCAMIRTPRPLRSLHTPNRP